MSCSSSSPLFSVTNRAKCYRLGDRRIITKTSSPSCFQHSFNSGFCEQFVCSTQEGWGKPSRDKSKTPHSISRIPTLQDGGHSHAQGSFKKRRLLGEIRPERRLPHGPSMESAPKVSLLPLERVSSGICLPPIWPSNCTKGVTKLRKPVVVLLRQMGIHLIIYLDDILIMASSKDLLLFHAATTLNLLERLGFIINYPKSQLVPSRQLEFLGHLVYSENLSLSLPGEKL